MESILDLSCILFFLVVLMTTVLVLPLLLLWNAAKGPGVRNLLRSRRFGLGSLLGLVAVIAVSLSLARLLGVDYVTEPDWGGQTLSSLSGLCCLVAFLLPFAFIIVTATYWIWCDFFESSAWRRRQSDPRSADPFAPVSQEPAGEQRGGVQPGDRTGDSPPEDREGKA